MRWAAVTSSGHMVQDSDTRICKSIGFWSAWIAVRLSSSKACPGPAAFVEAQNEGGELMAAGDAVEGKARPVAVRPADPDAGQMVRTGGVTHFNR